MISESLTHPALDTLPRLMQDTLFDTELRIRRMIETQLGHPYNLTVLPRVPTSLGSYLIAQGSDGPSSAADVAALEREAIAWLAQVWGGAEAEALSGAVSASGSEANLWALCLARAALPEAVVVYGTAAHPSVPRAAHLLRMASVPVQSLLCGEIDLSALGQAIAGLKGRPVVLNLTCGTSHTGAHDDIEGAIAVLDRAGLSRDRRFIHVDGALNGLVLPFLPSAPRAIKPDFRTGIDSMAVSGHKMIGTPMPCGVLVSRKVHLDRMEEGQTVGSRTMAGSRNGHAILAVWTRLMAHGVAGFTHDALRCTLRAADMAASLRSYGVDAAIQPHAMTVVFPAPSEEIACRYQLPCYNGEAHAIVMPSVPDGLIQRFIADYVAWFRTEADPG